MPIASRPEPPDRTLARTYADQAGVAKHVHLAARRVETRAVAQELLADVAPAPTPDVRLVSWTPDADVELVTGMLYPHSHLPESQLRDLVARMTA
ncbi:MAG: hypothetical protein ACRDZ4_04950, partial [Egibacteraceae bacterium]